MECVSIKQVINHMTSLVEITVFRPESKSCKGFFFEINFPLEFITGHVTYNPAYTYKFQLKTTLVLFMKEWVLLVFAESLYCVNFEIK